MEAKALWHESNLTSALREEPLPEDENPDYVLVKSLYSMISLGTESLVASGKIPSSMVNSMAVPYQQGALSLPVNYGYSLVGEVISPRHHLPNRERLLRPPGHRGDRAPSGSSSGIPVG